jgi:hypothetical protein
LAALRRGKGYPDFLRKEVVKGSKLAIALETQYYDVTLA